MDRPDSILSEDEEVADKSGGTNTFGDRVTGKKGAFQATKPQWRDSKQAEVVSRNELERFAT